MGSAFDAVSPDYVNLLTSSKWATRTDNDDEFCMLKDMLSVYLNESVVPGKKYTHGLALLIAHFYALDDTTPPDKGAAGGGVGSLTSESVGDVSFGYSGIPVSSSTQGWKAWLTQTTWGGQFLYLMGTFRASPMVT